MERYVVVCTIEINGHTSTKSVTGPFNKHELACDYANHMRKNYQPECFQVLVLDKTVIHPMFSFKP
jgi:hypothetical protein